MSHKVYEKTVLCCGGTGCIAGGSESIYLSFLNEIKRRSLDKNFRISITGCHGLCEMGPIVVVQPEGILYCHTLIEDVPEIIDKTLIKSDLVEHLVYKNPKTLEIIPKYKDIPFYKYQKRILLRNCGVINPENIKEYIKREGYLALRKAILDMSP
ncbi:MAG: NAD(P)H-dependent oxidoreductase subunit E, partial [Actinobacteria bacterium]|nr:NAD(P)H-dependent oxidoreductase subunit E [Actinomycetota bacterium]